jgi:hypothetical protein
LFAIFVPGPITPGIEVITKLNIPSLLSFLDDQRPREFERVFGIVKLGNVEIVSSQAIIQGVV